MTEGRKMDVQEYLDALSEQAKRVEELTKILLETTDKAISLQDEINAMVLAKIREEAREEMREVAEREN